MMNPLNWQLFLGVLMVSGTIVFHIFGLIFMVMISNKLARRFQFESLNNRALAVVLFSGLFVLAVHVVEIWIWAIAFYALGALPDIETALYFSTSTATTVGYGDMVLDSHWRLFGSLEAMAGMIVFGISTAFLMAILRIRLSEFFELHVLSKLKSGAVD
jgi:voltage-gated potassium channel Kch